MEADKKTSQSDQEVEKLEVEKLLSLLESGEYPRVILCSDEPNIVDADELIAAFSRSAKKIGRYAFSSMATGDN